MVEVTFTESAGGSLQCAFSLGKGKFHPPAIAIVGENEDESPYSEEQMAEETRRVEEEYRKKWKNSVPMEGNPKDVFCVALGLSLGDISGDLFGEERTAFMQDMICIPDERFANVAREQMEAYRHARDEILRRAADGEPVRLWYSHNPDEMCGFYHLLSILPPNSDIRAIKLPDYEEFPQCGSVRTYTGWGEMEPEMFHRYLPLEEKISEMARRMFQFRWKQLTEENAPVRAVISGKPTSAGEGLYDFYILRELDRRETVFHEAHLIGDVLGRYQLGISDWFIHKRIRYYEAEGLLEPVDKAPDSEPGYRRYLRKIKV